MAEEGLRVYSKCHIYSKCYIFIESKFPVVWHGFSGWSNESGEIDYTN